MGRSEIPPLPLPESMPPPEMPLLPWLPPLLTPEYPGGAAGNGMALGAPPPPEAATCPHEVAKHQPCCSTTAMFFAWDISRFCFSSSSNFFW